MPVKERSILSLCRKSSIVPAGRLELKRETISFTLHEHIEDVQEIWNQLTTDEIFSSADYLKVLEKDSPENLVHLYLIYYDQDDIPIGTVLMQRLILKFSDSFSYEDYTTDDSWISRIVQKIRQTVVSLFTFRMMTVGNLYLTGQYGFFFCDERYNRQEQFRLINKTLKFLRKELCNTPYRFQGILFKDYFDQDRPDHPNKLGMYEFCPDPNMILIIRESWQSFDDYLLDMKSKYRVRLKSALKKFKPVEKRVMDLHDVETHSQRMYDLYDKVLSGSGFVLAKGKEKYFYHLKNELGDRFHIYGYFLEGQLIGFYTWVLDPEKMDSHFIGFEPSLNHRHQLYLNILLNLVEDAISQKAPQLYYFRTALEIKSSVGAEPFGMSCFFKHNTSLINHTIIRFFFKYFVPKQQWIQRHPFKSGD